MLTTRTYAMLNRTTWRAEIWLDADGETYVRCFESAERPNRGLIKAWVNRELPRWRVAAEGDGGRPWARIERGSYRDESFNADGEQIEHAAWERDDNYDDTGDYAGLAANGVDVTWASDR